jgi:hypothetical protein
MVQVVKRSEPSAWRSFSCTYHQILEVDSEECSKHLHHANAPLTQPTLALLQELLIALKAKTLMATRFDPPALGLIRKASSQQQGLGWSPMGRQGSIRQVCVQICVKELPSSLPSPIRAAVLE